MTAVLAVPDRDLATALASAEGTARLVDRIVDSGVRVLAIGSDRLVGPGLHEPSRRAVRLDPTSAALALGPRLPEHGFLVTATPTRDHPYNVARRLLSLDHVLGGRVGILVGARDRGAVEPGGPAHDAAEFATVVRGLWGTWPRESLVGDRASGRFADTDLVRTLDHDGGPGGYRVRGPLTTPTSVQGLPVVAVWDDVDLPDADLVLSAASLTPLPEAEASPPVARVDVSEPDRASGPVPDGQRPRPTLRDLLAVAA